MKYKNILLIDDDQDDRELLLSAFKEISGTVECTAIEAGDIALDKLTAQALSPDAIFLDLNMPRLDGLEFLEQLRTMERYKQIPVIIYSTTYNIEASKDKLDNITNFITKPEKFEDLVETLRNVL